jgi:hypothetical protein
MERLPHDFLTSHSPISGEEFRSALPLLAKADPRFIG